MRMLQLDCRFQKDKNKKETRLNAWKKNVKIFYQNILRLSKTAGYRATKKIKAKLERLLSGYHEATILRSPNLKKVSKIIQVSNSSNAHAPARL